HIHLEERTDESHGLGGAQRVLQHRDALSSPPRERAGVAEASCIEHGKEGQVPFATQRQPAFEQANGVAELSPRDLEMGKNPAHQGLAIGVIERLSEAEAFLAVGDAFLELSLVSERKSQLSEGRHGGKCGLAEAFPAPITSEPLADPPEEILGPSIVPRPVAGHPEVEISRHLERNISE